MYASRLQRLRTALTKANLDCAITIAGPNLYYLTGLLFHLSERPTVGFFPVSGTPVIVAGALEESKITSDPPYPIKAIAYTDADGPASAFREAAQSLKLSRARLGIESRRMRVMELRFIEEAFLQPSILAA